MYAGKRGMDPHRLAIRHEGAPRSGFGPKSPHSRTLQSGPAGVVSDGGRCGDRLASPSSDLDCRRKRRPVLETARRLPPILCALALAMMVLWFPTGRSLPGWLTAFAVGCMVLGVLLERIIGQREPRHMPWLLAFAAASLASAWLSPFAEKSLHRGASGLLLLLVFPAAQSVAGTKGARTWLLRSMALALCMSAIDIVWQYATDRSLLLGVPAPSDRWRFTGSLTNANEIGFVALLMPLAASGLRPIAGRFAAAATVAGVLLTGSRTTLGGLLVAASARSWFGSRVFLRWSIVVVVLVATIAWIGDLGAFRRRLGETMRPQDEIRLRTWRIAGEAFLERPWLGQGPAVFFEVNEDSRKSERPEGWETPPGGMPWVHNVPLELLTERGIVGAGIFAILAALAVRDLRRGLRDPGLRPWAGSIAASLIAFAAMSMLDLTLLKDWCSVCLWISLGFAASLGEEADPARSAA